MNHKYRGKRIDTGEWVEGDLIVYFGDHYILPNRIPANTIRELDVSTVRNIGQLVVKVHPDSVGKSLEVEDKKGVEVYERDIVLSGYKILKNQKHVILWDVDHQRYYRYMRADKTGGPFTWDGAQAEVSIVIGNTKDNPELLEK